MERQPANVAEKRTDMNPCIFDSYVYLDDFSVTPRYRQLVSSIVSAVEQRVLQPGDLLPSINEVCFNYDISKGTVTKAYKELQQQGVIVSSPGKASRIALQPSGARLPVLVLLQAVCERKQQWLAAFTAALESEASVEVRIANCPFADLQELLERSGHRYRYCVLWAEGPFDEAFERWTRTNPLKDKLVVVQRCNRPVPVGLFAQVNCSEKKGFTAALEEQQFRLQRYQRFVFVQAGNSLDSAQHCQSIREFCAAHHFSFAARPAEEPAIEKQAVYVCSNEEAMVSLVKKIKTSGLSIGRDVGVVALFESPLMGFLENGITTLSPDYPVVGEHLASLLLQGKRGRLTVPFRTVVRRSL